MNEFRILILLGSLRAASANRLLAEAVVAAAPSGFRVEIASGLADLPHYNEDIDNDAHRPIAVDAFCAQLRDCDAILVVTPEYNGTLSSVVKNAIDWGSRPSRRGPLAGKPAAVIGATFGRHGGVWSQRDGRRALATAGAHVVAEPQIAIGQAHARFADMPPRDDSALQAEIVAVCDALRAAADGTSAAPSAEAFAFN